MKNKFLVLVALLFVCGVNVFAGYGMSQCQGNVSVSANDNLGNHTATEALNMNSNGVYGATYIAGTTMTVTGNAFSVGGTTISVVQGIVTLSTTAVTDSNVGLLHTSATVGRATFATIAAPIHDQEIGHPLEKNAGGTDQLVWTALHFR